MITTSRRMPLLHLTLALAVWGSAACDRAHDTESAGVVDEEVASAIDAALGSADSTVRRAAAALRAGRAWEATRLLLPLVQGARADSAAPHVSIVAAQAAAAWGGAEEAARVLGRGSWRQSGFAGDGHELLARLALEDGAAARAAAHADSALASTKGSTARGVRLTLLARALDRAGARDSAAASYARAAKLLPRVGEWLALRAAGVERDAGARDDLYEQVDREAARARVPWTEAIALELSGDPRRAAALYDSLGARAQALRIRLMLDSSDAGARAQLRRRAFDLLASPRSTAEWRRSMAIVDSAFPERTAAEQLVIARGAARRGSSAQAMRAYTRAAAGDAQLTAQDHYDYAVALTGTGRWADAARRFARVRPPSSLAGRAAYQRARALLRAGQGSAARTALRRVLRDFPDDAAASAPALYLLADLATDEGRDAAARSAWRELVTKYPRSALAGTAAFKAALIAYIAGDVRAAAREWDAAARAYPDGSESLSSRYWAGRAHARLGDTAAARARWRDVMERSPTSYYAMLAARRLGVPMWRPPAAADAPPNVAFVDSAMQRIAMLDSLGMRVELGYERDALLERIEGDVDATIAAGAAFRASGQSSRAIALGYDAERAGSKDARTYRLIYPLLHLDALKAAAARAKLDPALVAALVRQESSFNPRAISPVGARGLMQLMPTVGRSIARSKDYPLWDEALLLQPTVSFDLGTTHLAGDLRRYDDLTRALAAYNAGGSRVRRWAEKRGVEDPEVFAERIPYTETRDYVRIVQRNVPMYRALYDM